MSKFTFGTPTTTASTPGFGFNTQTPAPSFGATSFGASTPASGAATAQPAAQQSTPGLNFSFGTAQSAAAPAAQPALGGTLTSGSSLFGTTPAQPTLGQATLGQQTLGQQTQLSQPTLGQQTQLDQPILGQQTQLGQSILSQPTLGQQTQLGQSILGQPILGQQTQLDQPAQSTGLTFGTPTAKPAGLSFGTTGQSGFGVPSTTTGGLKPGGLGSLTQTAGGLSFGTTPATGGLTFGTSTPATGGLSFGTTTPATGSLSFGTTTAGTAVTSSILSFGATAATTSAPSLFTSSTGGLFGVKPATTTAVAVTTATATSRGLGGLDVSVSNKGLAQGSTSPTAAKENVLPNELLQTIDGFKEFVKTQKVLSSDIARGSARPLNRCAEDTASLMEMLTTLAGSVQRDRSLVDKLKQDTAKALQNAEIAQRTHDTPAGLQYENNAPLLFFMELSENFEHDLMLFKSQIETTEKYIQTMMSPKTLTPQELTMAMNKLHESLVAVAGRLQAVDQKVQQQKEQYLNFRKYVLKDSTNVFEDIKSNGKSSRNSIGKVTSGPTPFGPGNRSFLSSTALNSSQTPSYGTPNPLGEN